MGRIPFAEDDNALHLDMPETVARGAQGVRTAADGQLGCHCAVDPKVGNAMSKDYRTACFTEKLPD